jgi:nucleoside-diphosphate-sugar epimerase
MITGVAGFIGSNVAAALLEKGHHVVGVDNMSAGRQAQHGRLREPPEFEMHYIDIRDEAR